VNFVLVHSVAVNSQLRCEQERDAHKTRFKRVLARATLAKSQKYAILLRGIVPHALHLNFALALFAQSQYYILV
jgi:hypothetical protein